MTGALDARGTTAMGAPENTGALDGGGAAAVGGGAVAVGGGAVAVGGGAVAVGGGAVGADDTTATAGCKL